MAYLYANNHGSGDEEGQAIRKGTGSYPEGHRAGLWGVTGEVAYIRTRVAIYDSLDYGSDCAMYRHSAAEELAYMEVGTTRAPMWGGLVRLTSTEETASPGSVAALCEVQRHMEHEAGNALKKRLLVANFWDQHGKVRYNAVK